ncbi:allophanate hydrolase [Kaarinaea lacus]
MTSLDITITGLHAAYNSGALSPRQVISAVLQCCEEYRDHNIWIHLLTDDDLEPYLERLQAHSLASLPLYGIPFAIKDNIDLAGCPTTAACPAYSYTPNRSAFVVEQLINAGAIPIGKTNMDQFATGLVGVRSPEPWGPCKNAFNKDYISGGSSAGSAVAVSLGLVSFSLGTDTAGSGRVPAAFNNIIGLKPSRGLLSMQGVVPACRSLDCVSIFALTTDDANRVLEQAAVYDQNDDYAKAISFENNQRHYGLPEDDFVFAVPAQEQLEFFGNDSAKHLFNESVAKLEAQGGRKKEIDFSPFIEAAKLLYEGPWVAERYVAVEDIITQNPDALLPVIKTIIGGAVSKTASDAFKAEYQMQHYRKVATRIFDNIEFLVIPTAGTIYTIAEVQADPIKLNSNLGYYTNFMNLLDCSGIAVPAGFQHKQLPWGITLVAPAMQDRKLLSIANRWQQSLELPLGATQLELPSMEKRNVVFDGDIAVVVCGAHMQGLPLNWQLSERGATLIKKTTTAGVYRMYALAGGPPYRPGLIRDSEHGNKIEVEVWSVPRSEFGSFVAGIPAPLGIGKVELIDGQWLPGFICEPYGIDDAEEITYKGGWRYHIETTP